MTTKKEKLVKMKNIAPGPRWIPGVGNVEINGEFNVSEEQAQQLEKALCVRVIKGGKK